jgi:2-polyprenyl-6-methoxyphenol hydroxylase-like FAD-dependent oxidoreductase
MRTALIVGAGIGGLSAGIALRQAGWNVRIFERAASPRELGFGLLVPPNAIPTLRHLGVADTVLARGFTPTGELRRMDGTAITRAAFPPPEALGGQTVVVLRAPLHGAPLEAVGVEAGPCRVDVEVVLRAYEREPRERTTVLLAQGRRTARVMRTTDPVACYVREAVVRMIPVRPLVKLLARINRRAGTDVSG